MFLQQTLNATVTRVSAAVASGKSSFHSLLVLGEERKLSVLCAALSPFPFYKILSLRLFFCIHETRYVSDVKVWSKSILARVLQIWRRINPVLTIRWPYLNKVVLFLCLVLSSHMETELHRLSTQEALPIFGVQQDAKLFKQECFINWCSVYPAQTRHW